jgi:hypothetical protein
MHITAKLKKRLQMTTKEILCVHCLTPLTGKEKTRDHVFPSGWYTDDTPSTVQRWIVPSCKECNGCSGKLEKELFLRLALCIDPAKAEASGMTKKLLRSFGIGSDISDKEKEIRKKELKELLAQTYPYSGEETLPGFGPHPGFAPELQKVIKIPDDLLISVLKKIFRGCEYMLNRQRYIKPPHILKVYHLHEEPAEVKTLMDKFASTKTLGPGFAIHRIALPNDGPVLYKAVIWGTLVSYASIDLDEVISTK